VTVLKLLSK